MTHVRDRSTVQATEDRPTGPGPKPEYDWVVLVDAHDHETGTAGKLAAHQFPGQRHRAFSVFIQDGDGRLLLQQRARTKYHFGGRWTNTCCSHPRPGEGILVAARRRLRDEMGLDRIELAEVGVFEYRAHDLASDLVEHELDHVIFGHCDDTPRPNPEEAADHAWCGVDELVSRLESEPDTFTPWLRPALDIFLATRIPVVSRGQVSESSSVSAATWSA